MSTDSEQMGGDDAGRLVRMPCDRWFMRLHDKFSGLAGSAEWTKEMIDAVADGQADNPEARVVLSDLHGRFLRAGVASSKPVLGSELDFYHGESAAEFIRQGNPLYTERHDDSAENWGDSTWDGGIAGHGGEMGLVHELMMSGCDGKDVPLAALRSGFYLDVNDSRDWIKRAFEDLKAGKVSLTDVRAALRDGCLNAVGHYYDFLYSGERYCDAGPMYRLKNMHGILDSGKEVRMYTKRGWPFGVKVPASSESLPLPRFNLDTIGSKIPGIKGAK